MVSIDKDNFDSLLSDVKREIDNCEFVAIDLELSGVSYFYEFRFYVFGLLVCLILFIYYPFHLIFTLFVDRFLNLNRQQSTSLMRMNIMK